MSDRRISVVISRMLGNDEKSSGLRGCMLISSTMIDSAMLKVNSRSRMNGGSGSGSTIIARIRMISTGPAAER